MEGNRVKNYKRISSKPVCIEMILVELEIIISWSLVNLMSKVAKKLQQSCRKESPLTSLNTKFCQIILALYEITIYVFEEIKIHCSIFR